jgi:hypothetical protein
MLEKGWSFEPFSGPFPPGSGPFRVRGTVYSGALERVAKRIPGGLAAICEAIALPEVTAVLQDGLFLASALYDIVPLIHLLGAVSRSGGPSVEQLVRSGARAAAERDVQSLYRAQMKSASAEEMAARLPRIFNRYFEPSRAEGAVVAPGAMETRFERLPAPYVGYYLWSNEGFIEGALGAIGAKEVRCAFGSAAADGDMSGIPMVRVSCRVTWSTG